MGIVSDVYDLLKNMAREMKEHGFDIHSGMAFGLGAKVWAETMQLSADPTTRHLISDWWLSGDVSGTGVAIAFGDEGRMVPPIPFFLLPNAPHDTAYMGKFEDIYELSQQGGDK